MMQSNNLVDGLRVFHNVAMGRLGTWSSARSLATLVWPRRTDVDEVRSVVTSLVQAEKFGTSIGSALRVLSRESRALRMQAAEKKAAALPPKLTVPMILFFLPVLFAVIMTPAIIQILRG